MNDFREACLAEARDRGYDDKQAADIADRAAKFVPEPKENADAKSE